MNQVVLQSERIHLVPLSDEHLEYEIELDADPEVMRFLGSGTARSREQVLESHAVRLSVSQRVLGLGFWVGFVEDEFVGWWILEPPERPDQGPVVGQAELGYRLLPRYWRRGLAKEGAGELIRYGFEDVGLNRIFAETMTVNAASRATMHAVGMRQVRTFHMDFDDALPGSQHGEVEYAISRQDWIAR